MTITTGHQIHTLSNQVLNSIGLKTAKKSHVDVGLALEAAGNAVLRGRQLLDFTGRRSFASACSSA